MTLDIVYTYVWLYNRYATSEYQIEFNHFNILSFNEFNYENLLQLYVNAPPLKKINTQTTRNYF